MLRNNFLSTFILIGPKLFLIAWEGLVDWGGVVWVREPQRKEPEGEKFFRVAIRYEIGYYRFIVGGVFSAPSSKTSQKLRSKPPQLRVPAVLLHTYAQVFSVQRWLREV